MISNTGGWKRGTIKFTGDAGIVAPALIAEEKHIDEMLQRIKEVLVKY